MKRGDSEYHSSYNDVRWVKWKDNRVIYFLSNFHDPSEVGTIRCRQKDGTLKTTLSKNSTRLQSIYGFCR